MMIRQPIVAGMFYPSEASRCRDDIGRLFSAAAAALDDPQAGLMASLPGRVVAGIVPHAGWAFSGEPAARTFEAIARTGTPATLVLLGASHRPRSRQAALFDRGVWRTPLGDVEIDERLAERIIETTSLIDANPAAHGDEHSLEVQLPLIQLRFPQAKIVPILVPPTQQADQVGLAIGRTLEIYDADAVVVGSTDLTHYGPRYGLAGHGSGSAGAQWAKQVNDAGVIDAVVRLAGHEVVAETSSKLSACGGGAVAATLAAARKLGATRGVVLEHVSSYEIMRDRFGQQSDDSVSYLSAVLG